MKRSRATFKRDTLLNLSIQSVSKCYRGNVWALRGFSLELGPGVLSLLGPNGAGKTIPMSILATITRASEGTVRWKGVDVAADPDALRAILGYLPQDFGVYVNLNAVEFLEYLAAVKSLDASTSRTRIGELLCMVNLTEVRKRPPGSLPVKSSLRHSTLGAIHVTERTLPSIFGSALGRIQRAV